MASRDHFSFLATMVAGLTLLLVGGCGNASPANKGHVLVQACLDNRVEDAKSATAAGADVNYEDRVRTPAGTLVGRTPLTVTVTKNNEALAAYLIEQGANVNQRSVDGMTPLIISVVSKQHRMATLLLKSGADANGQFDSVPVLFWAVTAQDLDMVSLLLEHGASPNDAKAGMPPLYMAMVKAKDDAAAARMADILLAKGARVNVVDANGNGILFHVADKGFARTTQRLIDAGEQVNRANKVGATPLHAAAKAGKADTVRVLLAAGARMDLKTADGKDAAALAKESGSAECQSLLSNSK